MTATIELNDACPGHWTPDFNFCLRVLTTACQAVGLNHDVTVSLHFVDAEESLALNSRWREKNTSTNVLSFRADWPEGLKNNLTSEPLGDIVICNGVVEDEAKDYEMRYSDRYTQMLVHATLHLLGFDHQNEEDRVEMEKLEKKFASSLGIESPYD